MNLPEEYLERMKALLGEEYDSWRSSMEEAPFQGLRINRSKLNKTEWQRLSPYQTESVPWCENGYYYDAKERPALDPYYYAGLYYLQEPSAMAPAAILKAEAGDRVLDLCAAPGGKSTELGACLKGTGGLLVSNDISNTRARALLKNLELFGIADLLVTSETPEKLADTFGCFFDRILVDAPCSGEGMFRKEPDLIKSWIERGPEYYAPIQREILKQAVRMLKPGGYLLYSTCTFAAVEDEETISWLLSEEPEMEVSEIRDFPGACRGIHGEGYVRLFPHKIHGEGHFAALLHKKAASDNLTKKESKVKTRPSRDPQLSALEKETDFLQWEEGFTQRFDRSRMMIRNNQVYLLPECFDANWKLRYLRTGLLLGEWKKQRFEPSQAAAMAVTGTDFANTFSLSRQDERVIRYLKGETIFLNDTEQLKKGWVLVCVDGYPLGWAKYTGSMLKNKYYAGWRWQS